MTSIEAMAGEQPNTAFDRDIAACVAELSPIVRKMIKEGHTPNAIIAALARMTAHTVNPDMVLFDS